MQIYANASSQLFSCASAKRSRRNNASPTQAPAATLSILARECVGYGQWRAAAQQAKNCRIAENRLITRSDGS